MTSFQLVSENKHKYDVVVVPCFSNEDNLEYGNILKKLKDENVFSSKVSSSYNYSFLNDEHLTNVIFVGLGEKEKLNYDSLFKSLVAAFKNINLNRELSILIKINEKSLLDNSLFIKASVLSFGAFEYKFDKYFSKKKKDNKISVSILFQGDFETNNKFLIESVNLGNCINISRDLINEPANVLTPEEFSNRCVDVLKDLDVEVCVYDEKWIEKEGLKALYEVGKASINKPRFIVMKYFGDKSSEESVAFVGKGLTYDSGGYSIKSSDGMVTMKCDMGGGAAVVASLALIAQQGLKINVYGIIPACENMISGEGFKPGDVIGSLSNKTIEILSTDAEGRLALADGVFYASNKLNANKIIDIATLTGACGIALGTKYAAIIDNNEEIFSDLVESTHNTTENIWRLPADEDYKELIKSDIADYKNIGGRYGGTITAGLFVGEFVENKPWAHIDIAYVSYNDFPSKTFPKKGGTGAGVELLYNFCKINQKK